MKYINIFLIILFFNTHSFSNENEIKFPIRYIDINLIVNDSLVCKKIRKIITDENNKLKNQYDFLIVDFHGEITSEKMAMGHFFDGSATLVVGTHTHVPTNDGRILKNGTAYLTDAGMCGDYNSVIGMNTENSVNRFYKRDSVKHFPAEGEASLCGAIIEANPKNGLASNISQFILGGQLQKDN